MTTRPAWLATAALGAAALLLSTAPGCQGGSCCRPCGPSAPSAPCGAPSAAAPGGGPASPAPESAAAALARQKSLGQALFAQKCAACHGAGGEGSAKAPPLVGPGALPADPRPTAALRRGRFLNAMDVGQFVLASMPPKGPRIPHEEVCAILAFALSANGIALSGPVDPSNAGAIVLHR